MKVWPETGTVSTGKKRQVGQESFLMAIEDTFTDHSKKQKTHWEIWLECLRWTWRVLLLEQSVAHRKPRMTSEHIRLRLKFCRAYEQCPVREWRRVAFSDEAKTCCSKKRIRPNIGRDRAVSWTLSSKDLPISSNCYFPQTRRTILDEFLNYREFADR